MLSLTASDTNQKIAIIYFIKVFLKYTMNVSYLYHQRVLLLLTKLASCFMLVYLHSGYLTWNSINSLYIGYWIPDL